MMVLMKAMTGTGTNVRHARCHISASSVVSGAMYSRFSYVQKSLRSVKILTTVSPLPLKDKFKEMLNEAQSTYCHGHVCLLDKSQSVLREYLNILTMSTSHLFLFTKN